MDYWIYLALIVLITIIPQITVTVVYRKYSNISISNGKNGKDLVNDMLFSNGIGNVTILPIDGVLTDHYNPRYKTINLSKDNFQNPSIASIAVAAHETGHAIQDNRGYFFLRLRQVLGSTTIVASNFSWIFIYMGFLLFYTPLIWVGIGLLGVVLLFDVVTLPVELNASSRARRYLIESGEYTREEIIGASKVLNAAAMTYLAATLAGVLQIIRLLALVKSND